jgi:hypothetical protein
MTPKRQNAKTPKRQNAKTPKRQNAKTPKRQNATVFDALAELGERTDEWAMV